MNTIKRYWIALPGLLLVLALSGNAISQKRVAGNSDALQYVWDVDYDTTEDWTSPLALVFGYEQWHWSVSQLVAAAHSSATAADTIQFSLWGLDGAGNLDSLSYFVAEPDSATPGLKYPKHHTFDIGTDVDTLYHYVDVFTMSKFLGVAGVDTGFGGGTSPKYRVVLTVKKR